MKQLIIKVCGMRQGDNIMQTERLAPDWMGFICWNGSPRFIGSAPDYLPVSCLRVGVFVNPTVGYVREMIALLNLDAVQLHGKESPHLCREVKCLPGKDVRPPLLIKAFSIVPDASFPDTSAYETVCDYFLFDTHCATVGGSGKTFDWKCMEQYKGTRPFLLSGGIGEEHAEAIRRFKHPMWAGIDLNSRFELAPALKDTERLGRFIHLIRKQKH